MLNLLARSQARSSAARTFLGSIAAICIAMHASAITLRFEAISSPPGSSSYISGISADGSTFFGQIYTGRFDAFRWTRAAGYQTLGIFYPNTSANATSASSDGSTILGNCYHDESMGRHYSDAFLWTQSGGQVKITMHGAPTWNQSTVYPTQLSPDASFFIGYTIDSGTYGEQFSRAFLRKNSDGTMTYPDPEPGYHWDRAYGASADGSIIVGVQSQPTDMAARWVGGVIQNLGVLPGDVYSSAQACSSDGSVIVGTSYKSGGPNRAFRWTSSGMVMLSPLPGKTDATVKCISADGSTIAGVSGSAAAFWKNSTGATDLKAYLSSRGANVANWSSFASINGVSGDGNKMVGIGFLSGVRSVWLADFNYSCHADLDLNSFVEDADFVLFVSAYDIFDCASPNMPIACPADLNDDHFVDDADFVLFATAYDQLICP